jgi:hypothetical protein
VHNGGHTLSLHPLGLLIECSANSGEVRTQGVQTKLCLSVVRGAERDELLDACIMRIRNHPLIGGNFRSALHFFFRALKLSWGKKGAF